MPTECSRDLFGYEVVEGRQVVAAFDGGEVTSDAGALLLGATDRAIGLVARFAACFDDGRVQAQVEHSVEAMVAQRVFGIALGYEDLVDHDQLRHDPVLATLAGKLTAPRQECAPLAGKSTLNRLEHAPSAPCRYHKIGHDAAAIEGLFVALFLEAHKAPPEEIILDLDATDDPAAWPSGRPLLPRLLRLLLLPAAVRVLRPASAGGQAPALEHRCLGGCRRGGRAHRRPDPRPLAAGEDRAAGGFGLCPGRADDLVRSQRRRLRLRPRPQRSAWSERSPKNSPRPRPKAWPRAGPHAASPTSPGARSTAGAARAGSSPRPSTCPRGQIRASS